MRYFIVRVDHYKHKADHYEVIGGPYSDPAIAKERRSSAALQFNSDRCEVQVWDEPVLDTAKSGGLDVHDSIKGSY